MIPRKFVIPAVLLAVVLSFAMGGMSYSASFGGGRSIVEVSYPPAIFVVALALLGVHLKKKKPELDGITRSPMAPAWKRIIALLLDFIVTTVMVFGLTSWIPVLLEYLDSGILQFDFVRHEQRWYDLTISMPLILIQMALVFCYLAFSNRHGGQSLGKNVMNIQVITDENSGLSSGKSAYRGLLEMSTVTLWIISVPMWLSRKDRRAWHDLAASTKVVDLTGGTAKSNRAT